MDFCTKGQRKPEGANVELWPGGGLRRVRVSSGRQGLLTGGGVPLKDLGQSQGGPRPSPIQILCDWLCSDFWDAHEESQVVVKVVKPKPGWQGAWGSSNPALAPSQSLRAPDWGEQGVAAAGGIVIRRFILHGDHHGSIPMTVGF